MSYWLHHAPGILDIKASVQVRKNKQTVGEFDFLYFDQETQKRHHLEVAVKFYLRHGTGQNLEDYIGPSGRDRLDRKMHLLFEKQLLLGQTDVGLEVIQALYGSADLAPLAFVKGMIFDLASEDPRSQKNLAPGLSPHCLRGFWLGEDDFALVTDERPDTRWCSIPRLFWLSLVITAQDDEALSGALILHRIEEYFQTHIDPLMLARLEYDAEIAAWKEIERYLVCPRIRKTNTHDLSVCSLTGG